MDPTAAVSPAARGRRGERGPRAHRRDPHAHRGRPLGLLAEHARRWQALNSQWDQWVVGYNSENASASSSAIRRAFGRLAARWASGSWSRRSAWAARHLARVLRARPSAAPRSLRLSAWDRYCRKLAAAGLARAPTEGPLDFLERVNAGNARSSPRPPRRSRGRYMSARYGDGATREELRELAAACAIPA